MQIIEWLNEKAPEGFKPQMVLANENKKALIWLPGNKFVDANRLESCLLRAKYLGCTQLVFRSWLESQVGKECYITHVAIDIDELPISDSALISLPGASVRSSCGGAGRHVFFRLASPIFCPDKPTAARIIKQITAPLVGLIESMGMKVCKADCRAFYVSGGKNAWIHQTDTFYSPEIAVGGADTPTLGEPRVAADRCLLDGDVPFEPEIRQWLQRFLVAGVLKTVRGRNPIYVGAAVECLRAEGERVETKSPCSGNGQVNGYIDVGSAWIQVWSYADGHAIWRFSAI